MDVGRDMTLKEFLDYFQVPLPPTRSRLTDGLESAVSGCQDSGSSATIPRAEYLPFLLFHYPKISFPFFSFEFRTCFGFQYHAPSCCTPPRGFFLMPAKPPKKIVASFPKKIPSCSTLLVFSQKGGTTGGGGASMVLVKLT